MKKILLITLLLLTTSLSFADPVLKGTNVDVTTAGTAVRISSVDLTAYSVVIKAKYSNTGLIYVGDSTVDNTGFSLRANEAISTGNVTFGGTTRKMNIKEIWIDSSVNGEGVEILYVLREEYEKGSNQD